jgi:hypothetical protein
MPKRTKVKLQNVTRIRAYALRRYAFGELLWIVNTFSASFRANCKNILLKK